MPYEDGQVPSAIEEIRLGVGQSFLLPCMLPVQPTSPEYRCAELLVLYSEVNSRSKARLRQVALYARGEKRLDGGK